MTEFFKPYEGKSPYLFVSYSHRDSAAVIDTIRPIHEQRYRLWYDEGIPAGSDWPRNIANHMRDCRTVLFFMSRTAIASPNCLSEMTTAARQKKPILLLRLEDIPENELPAKWKECLRTAVIILKNVVAHEGALWLRWAALLHDIGKTKTKRWEPSIGWTFHNHNYMGAKMVPEIFRRLKLPMGAEMKYVQKLVDLHMRPQVIADSEVTDSAVRRLLNDAGDDIDDLMTLCEADITSKNEVKKKMFLENFRMVREKLADLQVKDYKRLLQPVIDGNEIMEMFHLKPSREVGTLKQYLKDAVLDNKVENEREPLMKLLMEKAQSMGLVKVKN